MRQAFAHEASVLMPPEGDTGAPGAAVTVALCGHWEHDPPCPLAPHHTSARREGAEVHLRVLFAAEPELEDALRRRIDSALAAGALANGGNEAVTRWRLRYSGRSEVLPDETEHAGRLVGG